MTPMMRQYTELKQRYPGCILFFRLGDFYEMFGEDAKTAASELDLVLTTRDKTADAPEGKTPMCGVPHHSAENYIARLVAKGYRIALCEQTEDPSTAKGLVARDVVRVISAGTLIESSMLDESRANYLCSAYLGENSALCFADMSTGDISISLFSDAGMSKIENELASFAPAEVIIGGDETMRKSLQGFVDHNLGCLSTAGDEHFITENFSYIEKYFGKEQTIDLSEAEMLACGALLSFLNETQKSDLGHFKSLQRNRDLSRMELDVNTLRSLELCASMRTGEKKGSLLWALDKTKTSMGRRLIRSWILRPLIAVHPIKRRLMAVAELHSEGIVREEISFALKSVGDVERLIAKIAYGNAVSRDLAALSSSLQQLPAITELLSPFKSSALKDAAAMDILIDISERICSIIIENPPFSIREGGFIKSGVNTEVDRLRHLLENSSAELLNIEAKERERTGKKLKVGYNRVFGYYIEIPRSGSDDVPEHYIRKQTLSNCERFITQELKELESELLSAKDRLAQLEYRLFEELRADIATEAERIQKTAQIVAELDVLISFAEVAAKNNYCLPEIDTSGVIDIRDGRHPVVELMQEGALFVPNDTYLNKEGSRTAIITGPNMAGKSTYMRQTALIVLMAQIGAFVPARSARIGLVDRVFTRIGASDDLASGRSTFMLEMTEVADILHFATASSLLILDEIGRGTSTYDGMSVARAVLEHCADKRKLGAKTMFATHYHELTVLEDEVDGVKNFNISAKKRGDDVIFLRKIVPGGADDSYGIEVAGLAGVPDSVIKRAKSVLRSLESNEKVPMRRPSTVEPEATHHRDQLSILDMGANEVASIVRSTDINTITPIEAMNLLFELKKKL